MAYFEKNCARCHGPLGSFYGDDFGRHLATPTAMRAVVKEMVEGPARSTLPQTTAPTTLRLRDQSYSHAPTER